MTNTATVSVRLPTEMIERVDAASGGKRSGFVREALAEKLGRSETTFVPRTALGRRLGRLRQQRARTGGRLLDLDQINQLVDRRRGKPA